MKPIQAAGLMFLALGVVLLGLALVAPDAPVDQFSVLTTRRTDWIPWLLTLGTATAVGGALMALLDQGPGEARSPPPPWPNIVRRGAGDGPRI